MIKMNTKHKQLQKLYGFEKKQEGNRHFQRAFAQLNYLCALSDAKGGIHDATIEQAASQLAQNISGQEYTTAEHVRQIEIFLEPLAVEAKAYEFLCVAHAHIDMNWMWGYSETVSVTLDTFRTMLNLLAEYPDYIFSQSQASVYSIVEQYAPDMLEEIRRRVKEGRWEITASTWVEADKNMSDGESLSRHILYTKRYMKEMFDIDPDELKIDFEPDTFGHNLSVPEILQSGGVDYYYHCRGQVGEKILYRWAAPSGAEVILYNEPFWYNSTLNDEIAEYAPELARLTGSNTLLRLYGVGDHGGGPTRRDMEKLREMNAWPLYPKFTFSTLRRYFDAMALNKDKLPLLNGELNFICDGCYTTQHRIKAGNRRSQRQLRRAEYQAVTAWLLKKRVYPYKLLDDAWKKTLFNQFHDILPGSGVTETREYALGTYSQVAAATESVSKQAMWDLAAAMNTKSLLKGGDTGILADNRAAGAGAGYGQCSHTGGPVRVFHVFNPSLFQRTETCELVVWDYEGDISQVRVFDSEENLLLHQWLDGDVYWDHHYDTLLVQVTVPAGGYSSVVVKEQPDFEPKTWFTNEMQVQTPDTFVLENDHLKVELDSRSGAIVCFLDKDTNTQLADPSRGGGLFRLATEAVKKRITEREGHDKMDEMSAWFIGRYRKLRVLDEDIELEPTIRGPLRTAWLAKIPCEESDLEVLVWLDAGARELHYDVKCKWRHFGSDEVGVPNLHFHYPLPYACSSYRQDVPFNVTKRENNDMDVPANSFTLAERTGGGSSLFMLSRDKYGVRCSDDGVNLTLMRGAYHPDQTPEIDTHEIRFALATMPAESTNSELWKVSEQYLYPFSVLPGSFHDGTLPVTSSLMEVQSNIYISSVKMTQDGDAILLRAVELDGKTAELKIKLGFVAKSVRFTDVTETKSVTGSGKLQDDGRLFVCQLPPNSVCNVIIEKSKQE